MDPSDQVLQLYEQGCTPEVIAKAMSMAQGEVEALLYHGSGKFRMKANAAIAGQNPADRMLGIIMDIAENGTNEFVRLAAARTARDDLMGRKDNIGPTINVTAIEELTKRLEMVEVKRKQLSAPVEVQCPQ